MLRIIQMPIDHLPAEQAFLTERSQKLQPCDVIIKIISTQFMYLHPAQLRLFHVSQRKLRLTFSA